MKEEKGVSLDVELTAEDLKTLAGQFKAEYKEKSVQISLQTQKSS